jgi:hypothetical protein
LTGQTGQVQPLHKLGGTSQIGQVQLEHKEKGVRAIWSRVIRLGLQAGLDHFAPFSQHKQYIIQYMHHSLAIKSLNYYNKRFKHSVALTQMFSSPLR